MAKRRRRRQAPKQQKSSISNIDLTTLNPEGWATNRVAFEPAINEATMFEVTAAWSCIRLISESIGALPLHLYKRLPAGGKERAREHRLYDLLHVAPAPGLMPSSLKEALAVSLSVWGMAYLLPERVPGSGRVIALHPIPAAAVEPIYQNGDHYSTGLLGSQYGPPKRWRVTLNGRQKEYERDELIAIAGWGQTGYQGMAPFEIHRNAIGIALAADDYAARYFGQNAMPLGVLEHDQKLTPETRVELRKAWKWMHQGASNAHEIAILEGGVRYKSMQSNLHESQAIEVRKHQVIDVARIWRVPPHLIGVTDKATYNNVEQLNRHFLQHTLGPYLKRVEEALTVHLLSTEERKTYYIEFDAHGLLMADAKTQAEILKSQVLGGTLTQNEARSVMNYPPKAGGDELLVPQNMAPADMLHALLSSE